MLLFSLFVIELLDSFRSNDVLESIVALTAEWQANI